MQKMSGSIDTGQRFPNYCNFKEKFDDFCRAEGVIFSKDGKTVESANRRIKNESLHYQKKIVYSTIRFECKHFRAFESQISGKRKHQT